MFWSIISFTPLLVGEKLVICSYTAKAYHAGTKTPKTLAPRLQFLGLPASVGESHSVSVCSNAGSGDDGLDALCSSSSEVSVEDLMVGETAFSHSEAIFTFSGNSL